MSIYIHTIYIRMMYIYIYIYYILILYRVYILNIDKNTKLCQIVWCTHVTDLMISSHYDVMWTLFRRMFVCFGVSVCWSSDRWNRLIVRFDQIYLFANQKGFVSLSHMEMTSWNCTRDRDPELGAIRFFGGQSFSSNATLSVSFLSQSRCFFF